MGSAMQDDCSLRLVLGKKNMTLFAKITKKKKKEKAGHVTQVVVHFPSKQGL
jgi:hypothetical protein